MANLPLPPLPDNQTKPIKTDSIASEFGLPEINLPSVRYRTGKEYDLNDLEADEDFQARAKRFLASIGEDDDIFEYMRDSDFNLVSAMSRYNKSGKFTEQQKEDYAYLRTAFDGAKVGSAEQWLELIKDGAVDMVTDPTLLLAAIFTPFTGGGTLASRAVMGKQAINGLKLLGQANKKALTAPQLKKAIADGTLDQAAKNATKVAGGLGSLEVGGWMGLHNHANQNIELNTGLRTLYSRKELAGNVILGKVLGATVGAGGQAWSNFTNPVLKLGANKPTKTTSGLRLKLNQAFDNTLGRLFLGNARQLKGLEDQGIETAKLLRGLIDHDSQLGIGKRNSKKVDWSFPELLNARRGEYMFSLDKGLWKNLQKIAPDGSLPEEYSLAIIRYLRGDKKALNNTNKDVKAAAKDIRTWLDGIAKDAKDAGYGDIRIKNYFPREWDRKAIENNKPEFQKLLAKDLKISESEALEVIDGMLNLNNELYKSHSNLLTHRRKLELLDDNAYEKFMSTDLVSILANYGLNAANTIQTKLSWLGGNVARKSSVRKAIDTDMEEVMVFEGLRKNNLDLFEETWVKPLEAEVFEKLGRNLTRTERTDLRKTFESVTGSVTFFEGQIKQGVYDSLKLANSLAYLPLATASSLSEGLIAATRPGSKASKNFIYQLETGLSFLTSDMKSVLTRRRGLSDVEANREANSVFLAVDDTTSDLTNRLTGDALQTGWAKNIARDFFKLNTLLSWTKNVELSAFRTGKDIVEDSLRTLKEFQDAGVRVFDDVDTFVKSATGKEEDIIKKLEGIDGVWTGRGNLYQRTNYLKETLNDLGIDIQQGLNWVKRGANTESKFYTRDMSMAGGRFARSVILPTSREFSKVPRFMTNPRFDILTQFLRYPTAFSNTVLKNYVRDTLNNPAMSGPGFASFVVGSTAIARGTNYWRASPETQRAYDQYARKPATSLEGKIFDVFVAKSAEENLRAFQRVGLLGQYEWIQRAKDSYMVTGSVPGALVQSFGGPVIGDLTGMGMYNRGMFEIMARKAPLIGTRQIQKKYLGIDPYENIIQGAKDLDEKSSEAIEDMLSLLPGRNRYSEGGVVENETKGVDEELLLNMQKKNNYSNQELDRLRKHADYVGYVESDNIIDRVQLDGGPGRGYFQFEIGEAQGASTARNRLLKLYEDGLVNLTPQHLEMLGGKGSQSLDVSSFPKDLQHALFYADKFQDPGTDMKSFFSGEGLTHNDFWYKHHYRGDDLNKANLLNKRIEDRDMLPPGGVGR